MISVSSDQGLVCPLKSLLRRGVSVQGGKVSLSAHIIFLKRVELMIPTRLEVRERT
jgi:hypothetical protein